MFTGVALESDYWETVTSVDKNPAKILWGAVLAQGIDSSLRNVSSKEQEDRRWLFSDQYFIGSFNWICSLFNLNPAAIREIVLTERCYNVYNFYKPRSKRCQKRMRQRHERKRIKEVVPPL